MNQASNKDDAGRGGVDGVTKAKISFIRACLFPVRAYRKIKRLIVRVLNYLALRSLDLAELRKTYEQGGASSAESWVREVAKNQKQLCAYLSLLARLCIMTDPLRAVRLAEEVTLLDPKPFRNRWLAIIRFDAGEIRAAASLVRKEDLSLLREREREKVNFILGCARLTKRSVSIPSPTEIIRPAQENSLLYIASSSLPYHVSGYTTRTHSILTALKQKGWSVTCVTRPGYPEDRDDCVVKKQGTSVTVDGIEYVSLSGLHRRKVPLDRYFETSADALAEFAQELRPAVVHAASNYEAALPAMLASKKLGIPFVYEVRGLWEFTAASKRKGWENTERFALDRHLESLTAAQADRVFTLTDALADELVERGVQRQKISLAPNAVDPAAFQKLSRDESLATELELAIDGFTIGYIGSLVGYEGLDDLIRAFQMLIGSGVQAELVIVGSGSSISELKRLASSLGVGEHVRFTGRVSPKLVPSYMSLLDAIALPRKPVRVCELVSPLKPLEAMATRVPMVVSSVPALAEMVVDGETALVHRAGDACDLYEALKKMAENPKLRARLAENAHAHVIQHRTWQAVVGEMLHVHRELVVMSKAQRVGS